MNRVLIKGGILYTMVKDHRTSQEVSNVEGVLDGNLDPFINAYLKFMATAQ